MVETVNIPADRFSLISGFDRPGAVDTSKLTLGDPYVKFTASDGKDYYTRNFNHSSLLPTKMYLWLKMFEYIFYNSKISFMINSPSFVRKIFFVLYIKRIKFA